MPHTANWKADLMPLFTMANDLLYAEGKLQLNTGRKLRFAGTNIDVQLTMDEMFQSRLLVYPPTLEIFDVDEVPGHLLGNLPKGPLKLSEIPVHQLGVTSQGFLWYRPTGRLFTYAHGPRDKPLKLKMTVEEAQNTPLEFYAFSNVVFVPGPVAVREIADKLGALVDGGLYHIPSGRELTYANGGTPVQITPGPARNSGQRVCMSCFKVFYQPSTLLQSHTNCVVFPAATNKPRQPLPSQPGR